MARRTGDPARFVVGVHAKSVQAGMLPLPVIGALGPVVDELPGAKLVVDAHRMCSITMVPDTIPSCAGFSRPNLPGDESGSQSATATAT
jgi:hypothetical protein